MAFRDALEYQLGVLNDLIPKLEENINDKLVDMGYPYLKVRLVIGTDRQIEMAVFNEGELVDVNSLNDDDRHGIERALLVAYRKI